MKNKILVTLATIFACALFSVSAFAGYQINGITGRMDKVIVPPTISPFDTTAHGDTTWGNGSSFVWTMNAGATDPVFTFGSGTVDLNNASFTIHGTNSQVSFANNIGINGDTARKMKWYSTSGTYNEDLFWDNDTTSNTWAVTSSTGVTNIDFGTIGLRNSATNNAFGNVSIGTFGTPASTISGAGNVSIGTAYAVAHTAPANGMIVQGNVGIGTWITTSAMTVNGTVTASQFDSTSTTAGSALFYEDVANGSNYTELKGAANQATNNTFILPTADGTSGQALVTDGSHNLSFSTVSGGGLWTTVNTTDQSLIGGNVGIGTTNTLSSSFRILKNGTNDYVRINSTAGAGGDVFVIQNSGLIGINTINPVSQLQVNGTVTGNAFVGDGSGLTGISSAGGGWIDGGVNVYVGTTTDIVGIGTSAPLATLEVENVGSGDSFRVNDSLLDATPFFIDAAGNVGIGTTTSAVRLAILDSTGATGGLTVTNNSISTASLVTFSSSSTASVDGNRALLNLNASGASGSLSALIGTCAGGSGAFCMKFLDVANDTTPFVLDNSGNVGIGTLKPTAQLDVRFQTPTDPFHISSSATDSAGGFMVVTSSGNVGIGTTTPTARVSVWGTDTSTTPAFFIKDSAGTSRVSVLNNGNFGVGTLSPTSPLCVGSTCQFGVDSSGIVTPGGYKAADGTAGISATCGTTAVNTITIKNGLITACTGV